MKWLPLCCTGVLPAHFPAGALNCYEGEYVTLLVCLLDPADELE